MKKHDPTWEKILATLSALYPPGRLDIGEALDQMLKQQEQLDTDTIEVGGKEYHLAKNRAAGDMPCPWCREKYYDHPMFDGILDHGGHRFLTLLCGNLLVKL